MGRRALPPGATKARTYGTCQTPGCIVQRRIKSRPFCNRHNAQINNPQCSIEGCERYVWTMGTCSTHDSRMRKHGTYDDPEPPKNRYLWAGGYTMLYMPEHPSAPKTGLILEHRVVMEEMIGRPLLPGENVHHLNGAPNDNRPENLELWVVNQPYGQRPQDLVIWAKEILDRYGAWERAADA